MSVFTNDLIMLEVLRNLGIDNLKNCRLVCRRWRELSVHFVVMSFTNRSGRNDRMLLNYTESCFGDAVHFKLTSVEVTDFRLRSLRHREDYTSFGRLELSPEELGLMFNWLRSHGPHIRSINLQLNWIYRHYTLSSDSMETLWELLNHLTGLEELTLTGRFLMLPPVDEEGLFEKKSLPPSLTPPRIFPSVHVLHLALDWGSCLTNQPTDEQCALIGNGLLTMFPCVKVWGFFKLKGEMGSSQFPGQEIKPLFQDPFLIYPYLWTRLGEIDEGLKATKAITSSSTPRSSRVHLDLLNLASATKHVRHVTSALMDCPPSFRNLVRNLSLVVRDLRNDVWEEALQLLAPNLTQFTLHININLKPMQYSPTPARQDQGICIPAMPRLAILSLRLQMSRSLRCGCESCPIPLIPFEVLDREGGRDLRIYLSSGRLQYQEDFPSLRNFQLDWPQECFSPSLLRRVGDLFLLLGQDTTQMSMGSAASSSLQFFMIPLPDSQRELCKELFSEIEERAKITFPNATLVKRLF